MGARVSRRDRISTRFERGKQRYGVPADDHLHNLYGVKTATPAAQYMAVPNEAVML